MAPDAGPSLFGTPEQLAEARRFSREATTGGNKSRPGSRSSAFPSRPSSVTSDSSRSSFARKSYTHGGANTSAASFHLTPPPVSTHATRSLAASGSSFASNGALAPPTQPQAKPDVSFSKPNTFGSTTQSLSVDALGSSAIASPKVEKAVEPKPTTPAISKPSVTTLPASAAAAPYLRAKGWQTFTVDGAGTDKDMNAEKIETKKGDVGKPMIPTVKVEPAEPAALGPRVKQESEESDYIVIPKLPAATIEKSNAPPATAPAQAQSITVSVADFDRMMAEITSLTKQVATLTQRVGSLENENFQLQGKVEPMCQLQELRQYLGTKDAKAPFELSVKCPPGTYCKVQANATLKVADLIRRVRVASKTCPAESPAPRLAVEGKELGHALTLHEVGITSNSLVEFVHDGVMAEEDEEL